MEHLSFRLSDEFVAAYADREVAWGFPCGGGLTLGELNFVDKYSRQLEPYQAEARMRMGLRLAGSKERWFETVRRVIEGMYSIQKDHCLANRTPWQDEQATRSAEEAYERMFTFKWLPPGRGIWMMGTPFVATHGSASLLNCAFVSTGQPRGLVGAVHRLMEMSMLGVGVGFDSKAATDGLPVYTPGDYEVGTAYVTIDDSREGWCDATAMLVESYLVPGSPRLEFDYSAIRPRGAPIRGFGGTAAGPVPLRELHETLRTLLDPYAEAELEVDTILVGDILNLVARCVVAGNVRRSAEIWLGEDGDKQFLYAKDYATYPERNERDTGWGWASNNSVVARVGGHYEHLVERIAANGEPGLVYLDLCRSHGRLADPPNHRDYRVAGVNPCGEQPLEDGELCTLVNAYPTNCDDKADFLRTLKFAYLYAKTVTLVQTHWPDSNEVMNRNRRIGTSLAGLAEFVETRGWIELKEWMNDGYEVVQGWDVIYSEWLGVRESIKTTTEKPDGTTALLAGVTPGASWPVDRGCVLRRLRLDPSAPVVSALLAAGVPSEPDVTDARRIVVELPARYRDVRGQDEVSIWEKAELVAFAQRHWSDNSVSNTLTFRPDEAEQLGALIHAFDGRVKTISFLPSTPTEPYPQMPFEPIDVDAFEARYAAIGVVDRDALYLSTDDAQGERFCTTDACELPART